MNRGKIGRKVLWGIAVAGWVAAPAVQAEEGVPPGPRGPRMDGQRPGMVMRMEQHPGEPRMTMKKRGEGGIEAHAGRLFRRLMNKRDELKLTKDQIAQWRSLMTEGKKARLQAKADREIAMMDLADALHQETPDFEKARKLMKANSDRELALRLDQLAKLEKGYQLLTPDQRDQVKKLMHE